MRSTLVTLVILCSLPATTFGQSGSYLATVAEDGAKIVAGPGDQYPSTGSVHQGDSLFIDHEEPNGWLAVQVAPGKMYSVSWVPIQFVNFDTTKPTPQNVSVEEETKLAPGQIGTANTVTNIRLTTVPAGTILTVIGPKTTVDGKSWYPVIPPAGDFRFIAKKSVRTDKVVNTSYTVHDNAISPLPATPASGSVAQASSNIPPQPVALGPATGGLAPAPVMGAPVAVTASTPATPAKPIVQNPLWTQAEAAEQDGRLDDAEKLYFKLAQLMNAPGGDHDIANLCYTRIHSLREKLRAASPGTSATTPRSVVGSTAQLSKASVVTTDTAAIPSAVNQKPGYAATGKLSYSALWIDGQRTYAVEGTPGVTQVYVVAGTGVDLDRYINKRVDIYGSSSTRKDVSKPVIVASGAEMAQ
jgi:hypothetical protein